jgi:hypothetical protein
MRMGTSFRVREDEHGVPRSLDRAPAEQQVDRRQAQVPQRAVVGVEEH